MIRTASLVLLLEAQQLLAYELFFEAVNIPLLLLKLSL